MNGARSKHQREVLEAESSTLRIVAVADTHSEPHAESAARIRALEPAAILHGGDIGRLEVLDALGEIAPVFAVRGNIDARTPGLADSMTLAVRSQGRELLTVFLTHIAVQGPLVRADIAKRARAEGAALVVCGHSHVPFMGRDKGITVFNPGSIGPRRFKLPIVFGVIDVAPDGVRLRHVDCETGEPWRPVKTAC
ncbi:MAG: metallophosphoesterase family protein [Polyangiaceae bacterium]